MKTQLTILVSFLLVTGTAMADQSTSATTVEATSYSAHYSAKQLIDLCKKEGYAKVDLGTAQLLDGAAPAANITPVNGAPSASVTPVASAQASATASADAKDCGECCDKMQAQIDAINAKLATYEAKRAALERRVALLSGDPSKYADALAIVNQQLSQVTTAQATLINETNAKFDAVNARLDKVHRVNERQDREITANTDEIGKLKSNDAVQDASIDALDARKDAQLKTDQMQNEAISDVRRARSSAEFGVHLGGLTLVGSKFDNVSGLLGVDLTLRVGGRWYWYGSPSLLAMGGKDRHFGAMFRSGLGVDLMGDFNRDGIADSSFATGSLEFGGMLTSLQLNNRFEGKYVSLEPTVGMVFRFPHGINAGAFIHAGPTGDVQGNMAGTFGGGIELGFTPGSRH